MEKAILLMGIFFLIVALIGVIFAELSITEIQQIRNIAYASLSFGVSNLMFIILLIEVTGIGQKKEKNP